MYNSGPRPYHGQPVPPTMPHSTYLGSKSSLGHVIQQVRASIIPEFEETVYAAMRRHYDGIIGHVKEEVHSSVSGAIEHLERRLTEQQQDMNVWKAKTADIDTKLQDVLIKYNGTMDRIGIVVNLTDRVIDDITGLRSRMDALKSSGQVGTWTPTSPISNPPTPRPAAPHGAGISGPRIQHTSDVQEGSGRPATTASPKSVPQEIPTTHLAAAPLVTHTSEARPGYVRCPFCQKELTRHYMMGAHRLKYCKKSPSHIKLSPRR